MASYGNSIITFFEEVPFSAMITLLSFYSYIYSDSSFYFPVSLPILVIFCRHCNGCKIRLAFKYVEVRRKILAFVTLQLTLVDCKLNACQQHNGS